MQQPELRGCPFCGAAPIRYTWVSSVAFVCGNDACPTSPETNFHTDEAEAIAAWNRRAPQEPTDGPE